MSVPVCSGSGEAGGMSSFMMRFCVSSSFCHSSITWGHRRGWLPQGASAKAGCAGTGDEDGPGYLGESAGLPPLGLPVGGYGGGQVPDSWSWLGRLAVSLASSLGAVSDDAGVGWGCHGPHGSRVHQGETHLCHPSESLLTELAMPHQGSGGTGAVRTGVQAESMLLKREPRCSDMWPP